MKPCKHCKGSGRAPLDVSDVSFGMTVIFKLEGAERLVVKSHVAKGNDVLIVDPKNGSVAHTFRDLRDLAADLSDPNGFYRLQIK